MKSFKRIRAGGGANQISAHDINMVFTILEDLEGIGCRVVKGASGKWFIVVDGCSTDTEQPEGTTGLGSDQFPDGTEIWGRVVYDQEDHKLVQYKCTWDKATSTFVENKTPVTVFTFPDGMEIRGRVVYDQDENKLVQYKYTWDMATKTFVEDETPVDIVTAVSHASQH